MHRSSLTPRFFLKKKFFWISCIRLGFFYFPKLWRRWGGAVCRQLSLHNLSFRGWGRRKGKKIRSEYIKAKLFARKHGMSQKEGIDKLPNEKNIWHGTGPSFPYKRNARNISAAWNNDFVKEISSLFSLSSFLVGFLYINPWLCIAVPPPPSQTLLVGRQKKGESIMQQLLPQADNNTQQSGLWRNGLGTHEEKKVGESCVWSGNSTTILWENNCFICDCPLLAFFCFVCIFVYIYTSVGDSFLLAPCLASSYPNLAMGRYGDRSDEKKNKRTTHEGIPYTCVFPDSSSPRPFSLPTLLNRMEENGRMPGSVFLLSILRHFRGISHFWFACLIFLKANN